VSSAFTSLVSKIENYYADRDYTTEDAEYLSRLAIVEYAKTKNALVASARQVSTASIDNIIETAIHINLDADPSEWMLFAANAVDNVLNYAHEGVLASGLGEYTDFLPLGHPSRTNRGVMTASALSRVTASWAAGDPRIASEQARLDVYAAYSTKPGTIEAEYAGAKLSALVAAGYVPEDVVLPITAAFKMSFAMRSAMAKALAAVRRRHRDGRFAEEFGRLKGFFSRKDGSIFSESARIVGAEPNTNNFQIEIKDSPEIPDGVYTIDAAKTLPVKAVLSKRALSKVKGLKMDSTIANPTEADRASAVPLDEFLKTRTDAPLGWTKNEDGSFTSKSGQTVRAVDKAPEGDFMMEGAGENGQIDPNQPIFEITDKDGKTLGVAQDWAGLNKIGMSYDALNGESDGTKDEPGLDQNAGEGNNWYDSAIDWDHLSDSQNWSQFKDGEATYTSPDGKLKLTWEPDGETDGDSMRDLSGISVQYDGEDLGSYLATQSDLEDGDIADGLEKLLKGSDFNPDMLTRADSNGNVEYYGKNGGSAFVEKDGKGGWKVTKEITQGMIDENIEHDYLKEETFNNPEDARKSAEEFAKILNDPEKMYDVLYNDWRDGGVGLDQNAGDTPELSAVGKEIAKGLGEHKFFYEEDADGNLSGGEDTYTSPDGRVQIKYRDGSWFDDEKGYVSWDEMNVYVDGKRIDNVIRNKRESWPDFLDRVAKLSEIGLDNPNFAEDKKAKREADRKAYEEFYNSPEQVQKRAEEAFAREQEAIATEQARKAADKEGLLDKVDDLANRIIEGGSGDDIWVGDEDEDGYRNWSVYNEDGDEVATGNFGPNWDEKDLAADIRDNINSYLDKKMEEDADAQLGFDQEAGEKPLSPKMMEPATDKQYALLDELNSERDGIDPVTQQAVADALKDKNLTKAQMSSLLGELTKKPFKPGIDPTKPTERQINSLQGYLLTKELSDEEVNDILSQLDAGLDRAGIESLTAKLRRRPDRQPLEGLDQLAGIDSEFDDEYDQAHAKISSRIDAALDEYETGLNDKGLSEDEISAKMDEAFQAAEDLRQASYVADPQDAERSIANDNFDGVFDSIVSDISKNADDLEARKTKNLEDTDQAKVDRVQEAMDNDDVADLERMLADPSYDWIHGEIEDALADINARNGGDSAGFDQNVSEDFYDKWEQLPSSTQNQITNEVSDYLEDLKSKNPQDYAMLMYEVAQTSPDGRRVLEKPRQYAAEFLSYLMEDDPESAADILERAGLSVDDSYNFGLDQAPGKTLSPKMMEPATEAQYNYLKNLSETKADIDPETAQAIKEALDSNNLTKAQAGAFIGKLRDLGDKENMGQYGKPSQKMIDSVKRDVYAKGLSDADREEILKDLENRSKGDVSSIISMLKEMDDVEGGIEKYIDSLREKGDVEALKRLRADERYGRWSSQMDDALAKMDSKEQGLDQAPGKKSSYNPQVNKDEYASLAEEVENSEEIGYAFLNKDFVDGLDFTDPEDGYSLYTELMDAYKAMRPTSEEGKALEARLKQAADDLLAKIEAELGPIEAAKRDKDDLGSSFEFDNAVDDLPDFFDYYFPTDVSDGMRNGDGGSVGDVRGGGWEASLFQDEETGKWKVDMTSPGQASESYSQEFDDQDEAADWAASELDSNNSMERDRDTSILAEDGLDGLIAEYGDNPKDLAAALEGIIVWLQGTNRGMGEKIARTLDDYLDRLREQIAKNPKA
jgi:hypothetical protein